VEFFAGAFALNAPQVFVIGIVFFVGGMAVMNFINKKEERKRMKRIGDLVDILEQEGKIIEYCNTCGRII
jgi:hypothetical protein